MGEVICEREFTSLIGGERFPFLVHWMKPEPDRPVSSGQHVSWRRDYIINWPDQPARRRYAMCVDSTQALILALSVVESELRDATWPVHWFDDTVSLGLPALETRPGE